MSTPEHQSTALDITTKNGAWAPEVKARAKVLWATVANRSAATVEVLMKREAEAEALAAGRVDDDGAPMARPVPAFHTIYVWAKQDDWADDASTYMLATYQKDRDELEEQL